MKRNDWNKLALTSILGLLLSYAFVFLAALPLRYLRLTFGRKAFVLSSLLGFVGLLALGLWQWSLVYFSLCLLIGAYRELEEKNFSIFVASLAAIGTAAGAAFAAILGYSKIKGLTLKTFLDTQSTPLVEQLKQMPRFKEASLEQFIWYLPSGAIITFMVIVFVSLTVSRLPQNSHNNIQLRMFRLPDWLIWVFIGSLGATFIPAAGETLNLIAMNVLAITLAAYFFQGLAVFTHFLDRLSIVGFWRLLAYFLVFFQMFIFVSGLGILDYWFDFRLQPTNRYTQKTFN